MIRFDRTNPGTPYWVDLILLMAAVTESSVTAVLAESSDHSIFGFWLTSFFSWATV